MLEPDGRASLKVLDEGLFEIAFKLKLEWLKKSGQMKIWGKSTPSRKHTSKDSQWNYDQLVLFGTVEGHKGGIWGGE